MRRKTLCDGKTWLRSDRSTLIPRQDPGKAGAGGVYPHAIVPGPKGDVFIYSCGIASAHGRIGTKGRNANGEMLLHRLRQDGFAYLEPTGGGGEFSTRTLVPNKSTLTVNYQAPNGEVRVQVSRLDGRPYPGYSFKDCIPLVSDDTGAKVRWKKRQSLKKLIGKPLRIDVRMFNARIYALRFDAKLWYTATREAIDRI